MHVNFGLWSRRLSAGECMWVPTYQVHMPPVLKFAGSRLKLVYE